ncbi:MAG TPA: argininosuccinate lyase, partial [Kiritimatiellia bacterium]|nr:argininosuccinate lyase [Kiritimatiellia bacterium]
APSGYNRDLQEIKEPFLEGFEVTISSLRILTALVKGLEADPEALRRGFRPEVFATDRALELVATGIPFRDAYHQVKAQLDRLVDQSPDQALAAKRHLGAPMGLDWAALAARARQAATWAQRICARHRACRDRLLNPEPA